MVRRSLDFFPRVAGFYTSRSTFSRRYVENEEQLNTLRYNYNGSRNLYWSAYPLKKLDRMFFDIDADSYEQTVNFHKFLQSHAFLHSVVCSGRNYQVYVFTSENGHSRKCLRVNQLTLEGEAGVQSDHMCIGDISRLSRMIGTQNLKNRRYCVSTPEKVLMKGHDAVLKYASRPHRNEYFFGEKLYPMQAVAEVSSNENHIQPEEKSCKLAIVPDELPVCLLEVIKNPEASHVARFALCCYLKNIASFGTKNKKREIIDDVVSWLIKEAKWSDLNPTITEKQVSQIVRRGYVTRSCEWMKEKNLCLEEVCHALRN